MTSRSIEYKSILCIFSHCKSIFHALFVHCSLKELFSSKSAFFPRMLLSTRALVKAVVVSFYKWAFMTLLKLLRNENWELFLLFCPIEIANPVSSFSHFYRYSSHTQKSIDPVLAAYSFSEPKPIDLLEDFTNTIRMHLGLKCFVVAISSPLVNAPTKFVCVSSCLFRSKTIIHIVSILLLFVHSPHFCHNELISDLSAIFSLSISASSE